MVCLGSWCYIFHVFPPFDNRISIPKQLPAHRLKQMRRIGSAHGIFFLAGHCLWNQDAPQDVRRDMFPTNNTTCFWKPFKSKINITTYNALKVVMWNYTLRKNLMYSSKIAKLELVHLPWKPPHSRPSSLWVHPKHQKPRYTDGPQRRFTNFGYVGFTCSFCFTALVLICLNLI